MSEPLSGVETAQGQLNWLQRQFPRARELAVSPELLAAFEIEMVQAHRFVTTGAVAVVPAAPEVLRGRSGSVRITRLPLVYCTSRLSLVEMV